MRKLILLIIILLAVLGIISAASKYAPSLEKTKETLKQGNEKVKIVSEESVVIDVVKRVGPSVVTISSAATINESSLFFQDPFSFFDTPSSRRTESQDIGSGFVLNKDGIIVTNRHVVSDREARYTVITNNDTKYKVEKIYRDPLNDIAILQISPSENVGEKLNPIELGDSDSLQVGQLVIAIGTALGEFRNTVTTGVISGLGRGIVAGSAFEGYAEELDNVIQTDAAINPGNSGGPLLNSAGQAIGVNAAISQSGENIGFALPINVVKESLKNFNAGGQFNRPYLGVAYRMITRDIAIRNDVPEGAYVSSVIEGSSASKAGIKTGDIITKFDGQKIESKKTELAALIAKKKVGDRVTLTLWRDNKTLDVQIVLQSTPDQ
ncbi:MAG: trypsin-like peptidase domain-containing protein [Candidatus Levybacteria bacterium]|nr:trypsin-like peptidase domain-containing protein [Candidatus Levybacteria bacterium]